MHVNHLTHELILEILSRLPVKSLYRFKCVSKPWRILISDPSFIKMHLNQPHKPRLIGSFMSLFYSVGLEEYDGNDHILEAIDLDYPLESNSRNHQVRFLGSCNGLICIKHTSSIFIYNPCKTRDWKQIPDSPLERIVSSYPTTRTRLPHIIYGFGYKPSTDDYKFLEITQAGLAVYSLKTSCWNKKVQHFPYNFPISSHATPLNGAIHWVLSRCGDPNDQCNIAAFDLVEETWRELPLPDDAIEFNQFSLGVLNGCICLMHCEVYNTHREFWVMKDHGVKESWIKIEIKTFYRTLKPLCLVKNAKALMVIDLNRLVLCNLENGKYEDIFVRGSTDVLVTGSYVESLVSPNMRNGL